MAQVRSNIGQAGEEFLKDVEKQATEAATRAMNAAMLVGEERVKTIVATEAHDTGRFLRSITTEIRRSPDEVRGIIGTNLQYAEIIERGRKPGKWPRVNDLIKWVGRKLRHDGVPTKVNVTLEQLKELARSGGKPATVQQKAYRRHLEALYLIGRKIATQGIREKLVFKRVEPGLLAFFRQKLLQELESVT